VYSDSSHDSQTTENTLFGDASVGQETEDEICPTLHLYIAFRQAGWNLVFRESVLTPCSTDLLEKLTGSQLVTEFPAFYGTQRSNTALIRAVICPYPEPAQSVQAPIPLSEDPS